MGHVKLFFLSIYIFSIVLLYKMNNNKFTDGTFKRENVSLKSTMKALTSPSRKEGITQ